MVKDYQTDGARLQEGWWNITRWMMKNRFAIRHFEDEVGAAMFQNIFSGTKQ
jgi:hypothetical protein